MSHVRAEMVLMPRNVLMNLVRLCSPAPGIRLFSSEKLKKDRIRFSPVGPGPDPVHPGYDRPQLFKKKKKKSQIPVWALTLFCTSL